MVGWSSEHLSATATVGRNTIPGIVMLRVLQKPSNRRLLALCLCGLIFLRSLLRMVRAQRAGTGKDGSKAPGLVGPPFPRYAHKPNALEDPLVGWVIENGGVWLTATIRALLVPGPAAGQHWRNFWTNTLGSWIVVEGSILLQRLITHRLYDHVPYFSSEKAGRPEPGYGEMFKDWVSCNLTASSGISAWLCLALMTQSARDWETSENAPFKPLLFLKKLAIGRVVVDVCFYTFHWLLHHPTIYKALHKRHHEHHTTSIFTNFHFTPMDITLEGFLPNLVALIFLVKVLGHRVNRHEQILLFTYINWFEIGSHTGKPVPTISLFPPLAPVYNEIVDVDTQNIEFHERHHNLLKCNYGITQWLDRWLGTAKYFS